MERRYGKAPIDCGLLDIEVEEYIYCLYLPVYMAPAGRHRLSWGDIRLPRNLWFLDPMVRKLAQAELGNYPWEYIYLTVRKGWATPENPLNRPGWHADGFGTDDINWVWSDVHSTRFAIQDFTDITDDHVESLRQFEQQVDPAKIVTYPDKSLLRLDPYVVHATPLIPAPGCERSFIKISFSNDRYNLRGNAHNYLFDYDWKMYGRDEVRNDPGKAGKDSY